MDSGDKRAYYQLHLAMIIFGFAAILGDLIHLTAIILVWWRLLITILSLVWFTNMWHHWKHATNRHLFSWMGIGALVTVHWITFFDSIKLANASVALVCLSTSALFATFFESLIHRRWPQWRDILLALMVVPAMALIVSDLDLSFQSGLWMGLLSASLLALFGVLNKRLVTYGNPYFITMVEIFTGWLLIGFWLMLVPGSMEGFWPEGSDWIYLILLALGCTTLGYVLILKSLHRLPAFTAMLAFNLEPVYGIILAWILLDDSSQLSPGFYLGGGLILIIIFIQGIFQHRSRRVL